MKENQCKEVLIKVIELNLDSWKKDTDGRSNKYIVYREIMFKKDIRVWIIRNEGINKIQVTKEVIYEIYCEMKKKIWKQSSHLNKGRDYLKLIGWQKYYWSVWNRNEVNAGD